MGSASIDRMSLIDAVHSLDELAAGRVPDLDRALQGLLSLDPLLLCSGREQALHDAAATLELLVATGGTVSLFVSTRDRTGVMADAVRRVIELG